MSASSRIALYVPSLKGGGIERVFVNLARGFLEAGHPVDFLLAHREGPYLEQIPPEVRVIDLQATHVSLTLCALAQYLHRRRPAALFAAPCNVSAVALAAGYLVGGGTRIVPTEHSIFAETLRSTRGVKARVSLALARLAYAVADRAVAVSQDAADSLVACTRLCRKCVEVIHNPIIVTPAETAPGTALAPPWPIDVGEPLLLAAGRLVPEKDFPTLLRAFARLREQRPARLILLGEGTERASLEALARRLGVRASVHMPGFVRNPFPYMRAASVLVLSSRWEGFGNVLVEAMACGTPVVSTDCTGGASEILQGGRLGPLVPVGDDEALAQAIAATLDDPVPAGLLRERASNFSLERAVEAYLALVPA
jgi:glycosyltransferase involved in cell wall biosynthesis